MSDYIYTGDELYHYGVKGMKWGVRRAQKKQRRADREAYDQKRKDDWKAAKAKKKSFETREERKAYKKSDEYRKAKENDKNRQYERAYLTKGQRDKLYEDVTSKGKKYEYAYAERQTKSQLIYTARAYVASIATNAAIQATPRVLEAAAKFVNSRKAQQILALPAYEVIPAKRVKVY